jgi:uncharacterized protein (TIGR02246 family)
MMAQGETTGIREAIAAANEQFMARFRERDAAGMAALYTEDGWLLPPNSDSMRGREGIQAIWRAVADMGIQEALLEIVEVEQHGDTAIEVSTFTLQGEGGVVADKGKYLVVWKQVGGQWKLHRDIFNSSMPPPG